MLKKIAIWYLTKIMNKTFTKGKVEMVIRYNDWVYITIKNQNSDVFQI